MPIQHTIKYDAEIVDRQVDLDVDGFSEPDNTLYAVRSINSKSSIALPLMLPTRRVAKGAKVIPAEIGDYCEVFVRGVGAPILYVREGIPFKDCNDVNGLTALIRTLLVGSQA